MRHDHPIEPLVVEPDPTVYVVENGDHRRYFAPPVRVNEPVVGIERRPPRERERNGIDPIPDNDGIAIRAIPIPFRVNRVK